MSSTLKAAIQALKSRIADAFAAVEAKGGTLPATQDSANLPAAIASIPSGGNGLYYSLSQFGLTDAHIESLNSLTDKDIAESLPYIGDGVTASIPFVVCSMPATGEGALRPGRTLQNNQRIILLYINGGYYPNGNYSFYNAYTLQYLILAEGLLGSVSSCLGLFYNCYSLRAILGAPFVITGAQNNTNNFTNCPNLRSAKIKYLRNSDFTISGCPKLDSASLIYLLDNLVTPTSPRTLTINAANFTTLNTTAEGQAALAAAQAKGWTIA